VRKNPKTNDTSQRDLLNIWKNENYIVLQFLLCIHGSSFASIELDSSNW
jgi:hypothetical protein